MNKLRYISVIVPLLFLTGRAYSQAVSSVSGEDLENVPTAQLTQALEGKLPGLTIIETSSEPSLATFNTYVRGISTLQGTTPLVVVDGILMQSYNYDWITPAEIDSISVLKDASATNYYGLKGANGVILITTKHGKEGKFDVHATADFTVQMPTVKPLQLSAGEYLTLRKEGWMNDGSPGTFEDALGTGDNNWLSRYTRSCATMQRAGVTVSGGSDKVKAWANVNFMNQTSFIKRETDAYNSTPNKTWVNFRAKADVQIAGWLTADVQIAGNIQNNRMASSGLYDNGLYTTIFHLPPTMEGPVNEEGEVLTVKNVTDPTYGLINRSGYTKVANAYLSTSAGLKFDLDMLTKGLSLYGRIGYQSSNERFNYSTQTFSRYYYDYEKEEYVQLGSELNSNITNGVSGTFQYAINYIAGIDWLRSFAAHTVGASFYTYFIEEQNNTMLNEYPAAGMSYYSHNTGMKFHYGYDGKLDVNATLGFVGSDSFSRENRYTFTPAVNAGYRVIPNLKLRASWGIAASDDFNNNHIRYMYMDYIKRSGKVYMVGNPDLKAETRNEVDLGVDARFLSDFTFTGDVFYRRTNDMLIASSNYIPAYQGIDLDALSMVNKGSMRNVGFEATLAWGKNFGDFRLDAALQWSFTSNKVLYCADAAYPSDYAYPDRIEGFPAGQQFGYLTDGYIDNAQDLATYSSMYSEIGIPRMGDFKYKDVNGDGKINEKDQVPIGKGTVPTNLATVRLGFGWKNLRLDLDICGVMGYWGYVDYASELSYNGIYNDVHLNAWTAERSSSGSTITAPALSYASYSTSALANDWNICNRSFWRLKNASVSYRLKFVTFVLSGSNLITLSALKSKTIEPENGTYTTLPLLRTANLGLKFDF